MLNEQSPRKAVVKTNNGRMTPEHIDVKLLKALAEKPAGVRELSRITGTDLTVVLRHVHALKEDLRIRRLVPGEYEKYGISPHTNTVPYTIAKGEVRSAMWRRVISAISEYLEKGKDDIDPVLTEFLSLPTGIVPVINYWKFCTRDDLLVLLDLALAIMDKPPLVQYTLSEFVWNAAKMAGISPEHARITDKLIDKLVKRIADDPKNSFVLMLSFSNYFTVALTAGNAKRMGRIEWLIGTADENNTEPIKEILEGLFGNSEPFRTLIRDNRGALMSMDWSSRNLAQKTVIRYLRNLAEREA